jgi:hypothetical protein
VGISFAIGAGLGLVLELLIMLPMARIGMRIWPVVVLGLLGAPAIVFAAFEFVQGASEKNGGALVLILSVVVATSYWVGWVTAAFVAMIVGDKYRQYRVHRN